MNEQVIYQPRFSSGHRNEKNAPRDLRAVLFDLDGVIIDSEPFHVRALEQAVRELGRRIPPPGVGQFKGIREAQVAQAIVAFNDPTQTTSAEFIARKIRIFAALHHEVILVPGVIEFMAKCRAFALPMALTTSTLRENQERAFAQFDLAGFFQTVITGEDIIHGKPHPEPYLTTAQCLGVEPRHCLVIEDSIHGVTSGRAAGCRVVGITTSFSAAELRNAGAHPVVSSFEQLNPLLEGQWR
jgi:HAD superfamily hydrolase (TIGR01509 family)